MADERDSIHQIEYRWHDRRDLSPAASTMSQQSLRGWDSWIRTWVRHPHVDGLRESVRYQIHPAGRAALVWRFAYRQAAERDDGMRGRPLVSRVLAGQTNLLTPELAITLCGTGLPTMAGPRPGQFETETELPVIEVDELSALVRGRTAGLDQDAAQMEGLRQVVAAALSDPHTPLAIQLHDRYILMPPAESAQCLLLWGMWRIVWPLLGNSGRGWSFSTFEPPLAEVDPMTLPDILFRQARDTPTVAPVRPRKELRVQPFQPMPTDARYADLAGWLVSEYAERGGDGLTQLITDRCGTEPSLPRLSKIYDEMRATQLPVTTSRPSEQADPAPGPGQQASQSWFEKPDAHPTSSAYPGHPAHHEESAYPEPPAYQGQSEYQEAPAYPEAPQYPEPSPYPEESAYPQASEYPEPFEYPDEQSWADRTQHAAPAPPLPVFVVSDLLKRLPEAGDLQEFMSIMQDILSSDAQPDDDERVKARREVSKPGWYGNMCRLSDHVPLVDILSEIFKVIVIPDLSKSEVSKKISEWAWREPPVVIGGLLAAAKQSGEGIWLAMSRTLEPTLALRWAIDNDLQELYPAPAPQRARDSGRGRLSNLFNRG